MNTAKIYYNLRRFLASYFTYRCVCCEKPVRGDCLCDKCRKNISPARGHGKDFAFAYYYEGSPKEVMLRYKFHKDYAFCRDTLCGWLLESYKSFSDEKVDFAVSVPSWNKKNVRLSDLSKEFCALAEIPYAEGVLKKIRETKKQHDLSAEERRQNLIGAFESDDSVLGKTILLIDDICTTGSTVSECSKALYAKGAEKVLVLTVLKT